MKYISKEWLVTAGYDTRTIEHTGKLLDGVWNTKENDFFKESIICILKLILWRCSIHWIINKSVTTASQSGPMAQAFKPP